MALYTLRAVVNSVWNGIVYTDALSHIPLECVPCTVRETLQGYRVQMESTNPYTHAT